MSNCKAFGRLRARNHAIGQTPRGVLAPRFQNEFQGSAAFSIIEKATPASTPERRRQDTGATQAGTPERRRHDGRSPTKSTRRLRPSPPDNVDQVRPTRRARINAVEPEHAVSDHRVVAPITAQSIAAQPITAQSIAAQPIATHRSRRGRLRPSPPTAQPSESSQDLPP